MTVKQGEQVTLIGRTGAGKSTVFKLLLGLYQPESGAVTIGGVNVSDITDQERRTCIGCVEQHFSRVPGTVLEQITLGDPQITEEMAKKAARLVGMEAAIQTLPDGYDTVCTDGMFSQGEWQRCPLPAAAADRRCCCWMRSRPTSMLRRKPVFWKHCAAPLRAAPCSPFPTAFMKISAAGPHAGFPGGVPGKGDLQAAESGLHSPARMRYTTLEVITMRRKFWLLAAVCLLVCLLAGCGSKEQTVTPDFVLTYADNQPADYPTTQGAERFAALVKERTGGKVVIQVKSGGEYGTEQEVCSAVHWRH